MIRIMVLILLNKFYMMIIPNKLINVLVVALVCLFWTSITCNAQSNDTLPMNLEGLIVLGGSHEDSIVEISEMVGDPQEQSMKFYFFSEIIETQEECEAFEKFMESDSSGLVISAYYLIALKQLKRLTYVDISNFVLKFSNRKLYIPIQDTYFPVSCDEFGWILINDDIFEPALAIGNLLLYREGE